MEALTIRWSVPDDLEALVALGAEYCAAAGHRSCSCDDSIWMSKDLR